MRRYVKIISIVGILAVLATGCGKKNGAVDFCAIGYCYWLFVNIYIHKIKSLKDYKKKIKIGSIEK